MAVIDYEDREGEEERRGKGGWEGKVKGKRGVGKRGKSRGRRSGRERRRSFLGFSSVRPP